MNTLNRMMISVILIAGCGAVAANAEEAKSIKDAISHLYARESKAMEARNLSMILRNYAPTYYQVMPNGTKIKLINVQLSLPKLFKVASDVKDYFSVTGFAFYPQATISTIRHKTVAMIPDAKSKKLVRFVAESVSQDSWVRKEGSWVMISAKVVSEVQSLDGKVVKRK